GERDSHRFGLCSAHTFCKAEEPAVNTCRLQSFLAEFTTAVGEGKWHHDDIALLHLANVRSDIFDGADRFVAHTTTVLRLLQIVIRPQIAPADAGASDANHCVGWLNDS